MSPSHEPLLWSYRGASIDDAVLRADYLLLEQQVCFCMAGKLMGQALCAPCLRALPSGDRAKLEALRPGEGLAAEAIKMHHAALRAKGWRG